MSTPAPREFPPSGAPEPGDSHGAGLLARAGEGEVRGQIDIKTVSDLPADVLEAMGPDTPFVPPRDPLGARLAGYFGRHQLLLFGLSLVFLWAIMALPLSNRSDIHVGDIAKRDYVAPHVAFVPEKAETERRREAAAALVPPAYSLNPSARDQALSELRRLATRARATATSTPESGIGKAPTNSPPAASPAGHAAPKVSPPVPTAIAPERWGNVTAAAEAALRVVYVKCRIRSDVADDWKATLPSVQGAVQQAVNSGALTAGEAATVIDLAWRACHVPNVVVNQHATDEARHDARNGVLPVFLRVDANSVLVRQDQVVTEAQYAQLQDMGLVAPRFSWDEALAQLALCAMMVGAAAAYLARSRRDLLTRPAALWLVAVVPLLFLLAFRFVLRVPHADYVMAPLAATAAMLITVLVDARVGLATGFTVASMCALLVQADAGLFFASTLLTWIGSLAVGKLPSRFALARAFFMLSTSNAALAVAVGVLRGAPLEELYSAGAWSFGAGLGAVALMYGLATSLERPFGITSHLRLLELLSPDENVLRRMQAEAPGTYTHSLMVATLSENAAELVGADPLLCRVGGLYHDIGKLRRPHCFIENQSGDNIHDRLSPGLSALLIRAHVKDGLELGRALHLPQPVLEIIQEHHGTSLIAYFYHRAREQAALSGAGAVDEKSFRYTGPRPRSRESAIVMLADSIEASSRALPQITLESLAAHIKNMIETRLRDGELDESDLTLRELEIVREAFTCSLKGVLHHRIEYPDPAALSGELNASSDGWVRETLGERPENPEKAARKSVQVAAPAQKRQNKDKSREPRHGANGTETIVSGEQNGHGAVKTDKPHDKLPAEADLSRAAKRRRRRFKAPFSAPSSTSLHAAIPLGPTSKSPSDTDLPAQNGGQPHLVEGGQRILENAGSTPDGNGAHPVPVNGTNGANGYHPDAHGSGAAAQLSDAEYRGAPEHPAHAGNGAATVSQAD